MTEKTIPFSAEKGTGKQELIDMIFTYSEGLA